MNKYLKEVNAILNEFGLTVVDRRQKKHLVITCQRNDGKKFNLAMSVTPSCHRTIQNFRKTVRHLCAA